MEKKKFTPGVVGAIVTAVVVVAIIVFVALKPRSEDESKKGTVKPALTVTVTQPQRVAMPITLAANGNIAAWQEAIVGAEASGLRVAQVLVNVGDRVKQGQVLATLAGDTVRAEAAQSRATLAEAEAAAADAVNNAQRARTLEGTGALSTSQINQYLTAEKTAQAKVEAARAAVALQVARVSQSEVRAPDNGIISSRTATVGAVLNGGAELFRLIRGGRLEWRAEVTSTEIGKLTTGTTALVTAASGARLSGRVRTIGPTVDPQSRAALVYVDLTPLPANPGTTGNALAGMFARGEFDLGTASALTVPQSAIAIREGFSYVFRVEPDNRVTQVKVQTGRMAGERLEITSGLAADARVVASGAGFLNDGDLVRISEGAKPAGAKAASAAAKAAPAASAAKR
ncbi:efflux RND transporter periplasmic adaptor subunit [Caenimonas koreensis DSM 17982]|uniref:Efflux RND transporter periplasmic adaptor subunit n=1 Tax=Caenimonas koreensis DSM 17982 TaxID=1121255 RepID=A0A844AWZ9_9BURK|nr:efflux RND transporter periplasmic adaptor subunit [Caenimonas koreensis]MRD48594.1 efflux RND transporter periplasmic adaptor subunit [Caenimonas koreensis DSM 17982]